MLELLIVFVVVAILATLLLPVYAQMQARAQRIQCVANLRSLFTAADLQLQRNGSWPQIARGGNPVDFANSWIAALSIFGPTRKTWICPTMQSRSCTIPITPSRKMPGLTTSR